jgi:hypothetical protein
MENKKSTSPIMDSMKDEIAKELISSLLPKVKPFIKPAAEKLDNYLGDNERIIVIRRSSKSKSSKVIVLNANGEYDISCDGKGNKQFIADHLNNTEIKTAEHIFDINQFIDKFLCGEFK